MDHPATETFVATFAPYVAALFGVIAAITAQLAANCARKSEMPTYWSGEHIEHDFDPNADRAAGARNRNVNRSLFLQTITTWALVVTAFVGLAAAAPSSPFADGCAGGALLCFVGFGSWKAQRAYIEDKTIQATMEWYVLKGGPGRSIADPDRLTTQFAEKFPGLVKYLP